MIDISTNQPSAGTQLIPFVTDLQELAVEERLYRRANALGYSEGGGEATTSRKGQSCISAPRADQNEQHGKLLLTAPSYDRSEGYRFPMCDERSIIETTGL